MIDKFHCIFSPQFGAAIVAIWKPERQVRKASHCGSKWQ